MGQASFKKVYFRLEIISYAENFISISAILKMLANVFHSLGKRYVEIYVSPSVKYRLVGKQFVKMDYSSALTTDAISGDSVSFNGTAPIFWEGFVELDSSKLKDQLQRFSEKLYWRYSETYQFSVRLSFDSSTTKSNPFESLGNAKSPTRSTYDSHQCKLFSLGNIINGNRFISRFDTFALNNGHDSNPDQNDIKDISIEMLHHKKQFNLQFTILNKGPLGKRKFKLIYDYGSIKQATISSISRKEHFLHLTTSQPPKIFVEKYSSFRKKRSYSNGWTRWYDCDLIPQDTIGKSSVLRILVNNFHPIVQSLYTVRRFLNDQKSVDIFFGHIRLYFVAKKYEINLPELPFAVKYGIASINSITNAFQDDLNLNQTGEIFLNLIKSAVAHGVTHIIVCALNQLFYDYLAGRVINGYNHFENLVSKIAVDGPPDERNSKYIKFLRMAILTPTRLILTPPTQYRTSFFYDDTDPDHILRVMLRDDDSSNLGFAVRRKPEKYCKDYDGLFLKKIVHDRLLEMEDGFIVADRLFSYYGASSSQLREGGMVFYAKDEKNQSAASLRAALGTADEISLSKYMTRVGLSLSQLDGLVDLPKDTKVFTAPDIVGGSHPETGKSYNFTDGCGKISVSLARYIYNDLKSQGIVKDNDDVDHLPSAFQIRFMNSKGMVMVDPSLEGNAIVLTKSMIKMNGRQGKIGIIKMSGPKEAYLNKPFVAILFEIGLQVEVIMKFLLDTLKEFTNCFHDNQSAQFMLKRYSGIGQFIRINDFAKVGFKFYENSFFRSALSLISTHALNMIKTKQRIILPMDGARTMFGLADPTTKCPMELARFDKNGYMKPPKVSTYPEGLGTGVLKEGEVFIWPSDFSSPLVGDVIVTKFPASNLGDVQRLKAVNHPELAAKKIKDNIVFAVAGTRPECDKMGGADLDGDEYCVIWEDNFLSLKIRSPISYPDLNGPRKIEEKSPRNMIDYHINYLREDDVGQYGGQLSAWIDLEGAETQFYGDLCIASAIALDAPKHNIKSDFELNSKNKYPVAPDAMEKHGIISTYHSAKAPGAIYQYVGLFELFHSKEQMHHQIYNKLDKSLVHRFWRRYESYALEAADEYKKIVDQLMQRFGINSEVELLTLINSQKSNCSEWAASRKLDDSLTAIIKHTLIKKMDQIFNRNLCIESSEEKLAKASAYYIVSYQRTNINGLPFIGECGRNLIKLIQRSSKPQPKRCLTNICQRPLVPFNHLYGKINNICQKLQPWFELKSKFYSDPAWVVNDFNSCAEAILTKAISAYGSEDLRPKCPIEELSLMVDAFDDIKESELMMDSYDVEAQFGCYNDPISQIIMVLIKIELAQNENNDQNDNRIKSFMIDDSNGQVSARDVIECLKKIFPFIEIMEAPKKEKKCISISIDGPQAEILISQIVIGIHNRYCSPILQKLS